jgi:DNA-binding LacI/PurR family transcriptional regulator
MCNSGGDADREQRQLEQLAQQRVLGLLITPATQVPTSYLDRLVENGTRVVLVDPGAGSQDRCSVAVDDVLGGRLAGEHLAERGHQRVAYIGGPLTTRQVSDRHEGLREALSSAGGEDPLLIETPSTQMSVARDAVARLTDVPSRRRPTAVFCVNDIVAVGVLQELTKRGVRTPEDIAIVGYDDIAFAEAAAVPLSSVRQPREQLGRAAVELLLEESSGEPHKHRQVTFEPELVLRESSRKRRRRRST